MQKNERHKKIIGNTNSIFKYCFMLQQLVKYNFKKFKFHFGSWTCKGPTRPSKCTTPSKLFILFYHHNRALNSYHGLHASSLGTTELCVEPFWSPGIRKNDTFGRLYTLINYQNSSVGRLTSFLTLERKILIGTKMF